MGLTEVTPDSNPIPTMDAEVTMPAETSRNVGGSRRITADEGTIRRRRKTRESGRTQTLAAEAMIPDEPKR